MGYNMLSSTFISKLSRVIIGKRNNNNEVFNVEEYNSDKRNYFHSFEH